MNTRTEDLLSLVPFIGTGAAVARLLFPVGSSSPALPSPSVPLMDDSAAHRQAIIDGYAATNNVYGVNYGDVDINWWLTQDTLPGTNKPWPPASGLAPSSLQAAPTQYTQRMLFPTAPSINQIAVDTLRVQPSGGPGSSFPTIAGIHTGSPLVLVALAAAAYYLLKK